MIKESAAELPSVFESAMDVFAGKEQQPSSPPLSRSFGQAVVPSLSTTFNSQNPQPDPHAPDMNKLREAATYDSTKLVILEQDKLLTPQANIETIEKNIRNAQEVAAAGKAELAKIDAKPAEATAAKPGDDGKTGFLRTVGANVAAGAATNGLVNLGFNMAGIANPMTGPVIAACTTLKTVCDIAATTMGRGSFGDTTSSSDFREKPVRGKENRSYGYGRSESAPQPAAQPMATVMDNFNRMMSAIPGVGAPKPGSDLLARTDIAGAALADQEIKLGPEALARMEKSIDQLSLKAETAATAFETRRDRGATVSLPDAVDAILTTKLNPGGKDLAVNPGTKTVQIFNNMA